MQTKHIDFGEIRHSINNIVGALASAGYKEDSDALAILIQIIGYKTGDHFTELDEAADNYLDNLKRMRNYLDYGKATLSTPSPTVSAESD
ncbi:hypothetical protein BN8_p06901 (plasmid) [Fibrisoma limi BUZ 3]|uniref:Uncharacterized protein n=2 Tax=Fibrisoma limi TaxID=663275 RepID=I2GU91_9BACT|nr:hypothetical protein BN8_p06901 [Fibrisoma limi BUZ 3]